MSVRRLRGLGLQPHEFGLADSILEDIRYDGYRMACLPRLDLIKFPKKNLVLGCCEE